MSISRGSQVAGMLAEIRQTELGWEIYLACRWGYFGSYGNRPTKTTSRGLCLAALPCSLAQAGGIKPPSRLVFWHYACVSCPFPLPPELFTPLSFTSRLLSRSLCCCCYRIFTNYVGAVWLGLLYISSWHIQLFLLFFCFSFARRDLHCSGG